tara:strand:+ start:3000 stop:3398 length:399 start_codon:yes stop_codon:yes gene_type:complete
MTGIKIWFLFIVTSFVDILQYADNRKPTIDFVLLGVAVVAASIGSFVRIGYEGQTKKVSKKRVLFIYVCSLCVTYIIYELAVAYEQIKVLNVSAIIGGIISVDIIKFFIEDLPSLLKEFLRKKVIKEEDKEE